MPIQYIDIDVTSFISSYNGTGSVLKQTGYDGAWLKQNGSGVWIGWWFGVAPSGTIVNLNFVSLVSTPISTTKHYRMLYNGALIKDTEGNNFEFYYENSTWKCYRPNH